MNHISICNSLYKRKKETPFLMMGNEKWKCWVEKILRKLKWIFSHPKSWSSSEENHALCLVGLERNTVLWASTKEPNNKFRKVIRRIKDDNWTKTSRSSESEGRRVLSCQFTASCVFDNSTKLLELSWDVLLHLPYSPDIPLSNFYLFRSLQNFLNALTPTCTICGSHVSAPWGGVHYRWVTRICSVRRRAFDAASQRKPWISALALMR